MPLAHRQASCVTHFYQIGIIPESKLTKYLLIKLPKDDKSEFLATAGYTFEN